MRSSPGAGDTLLNPSHLLDRLLRSPPKICKATSLTDQPAHAVGLSHSSSVSPERRSSSAARSSVNRSSTHTGSGGRSSSCIVLGPFTFVLLFFSIPLRRPAPNNCP